MTLVSTGHLRNDVSRHSAVKVKATKFARTCGSSEVMRFVQVFIERLDWSNRKLSDPNVTDRTLTKFVCARQRQKVVEQEERGGQEGSWSVARGNWKNKVEDVSRSWKKNCIQLCA